MDKSDDGIVIEAMRRCGRSRLELFKHAYVASRAVHGKLPTSAAPAVDDYGKYEHTKVYPSYVIRYCLDIVRELTEVPADNVVDFPARKGAKIVKIATRHKPKQS
ncbi:MAG TPA: hypothetical protein VMU13_00855 [Candidatus Paceibacterota bacterium]|nr:hypothetical protein [Candidatus Paceibacterota bacterium]